MKKNKKLLTSALALMMATSAFASCGFGKGGDDGGFYTIDYYFIQNGTLTPQDLDVVEDAMNVILEEKLEAHVALHPVAAWSYDEKLNLLINSGDKFDICFTSSWVNNYKGKVAKEAYLDITEMLPEYAPTLYANVENQLYDALKVDGKIYGVLNLQVLPRTPGYAVEKESWEAFCAATGFTAADVKKSQDIEPYLAYVKANYSDAEFIYQPLDPSGLIVEGGFDDIMGITYPGAVSVGDDPADGLTVVNQFATDFYKEAFQMSVDFYKKGYIHNALEKSYDYAKGYCWNLATWKPGADGEQSQQAGGREMVTFPIGDSVMYNSWLLSNVNAISATSEDPVKSLKFLELLNTDKELYNLITYGVEGQHYMKVSDTRAEIVPNTKYTMSTVGWQFSNQFNAYLLPGQEDGVWEETAQLNKSAKYSPLIGFSFDSSEVDLELTNCYQAYMEYINEFIYGIDTEDGQFERQYNKFLTKLNLAGAEKIVAEMQSQLNAWLAAK